MRVLVIYELDHDIGHKSEKTITIKGHPSEYYVTLTLEWFELNKC